MRRGWLVLALLGVSLGALALRLPRLDQRPMHHDEAVNAILFQRLWERSEYRYDPDEYHGPTLHYGTLPFAWLSGTGGFDQLSERTLRLVAVTAGVALVLLVGLLREALGTTATVLAAVGIAVSPAMVFYSRYFIHEMLLVAFTLLLLGGAWRYGRTRHPGWAAVAGAGLGLMYATKETFVLTLGAMGLAGAVLRAWRGVGGGPADGGKGTWNRRHLALALGVAIAVALPLFTSFFTHPRGLLDSLLTYLPWLRRAGGHSPHLHPWYDYLERLFWFRAPRGRLWTEAGIGLLALVGLGAALAGRGLGSGSVRFVRFVAWFTLILAAGYSAIPYKTPWCLLNFLLPMILLAGVGGAALLRWAGKGPVGWGVGLVLVAGAAHLGWQGWRASQDPAVHRGNPYAYSPTLPGAIELADRVKGIAAVSPQGVGTEVKVVAPGSAYWPMPWYLRQLRNLWWMDGLSDDPYAPIMIVAAHLQAALDEASERRYLSVGYYELRSREFFELYVEFELWKAFVETLPRPREEDGDDEAADADEAEPRLSP